VLISKPACVAAESAGASPRGTVKNGRWTEWGYHRRSRCAGKVRGARAPGQPILRQ
jgi:hypothetical protein